jgi:hypothetical protein
MAMVDVAILAGTHGRPANGTTAILRDNHGIEGSGVQAVGVAPVFGRVRFRGSEVVSLAPRNRAFSAPGAQTIFGSGASTECRPWQSLLASMAPAKCVGEKG